MRIPRLLDQTINHPWLFTRKAIGRLRRRLISVPCGPIERKINGRVRFEFRPMPFLNEDDFRAMLTNSYDLILCDNFRRLLRPGDTVLDVGANVGYISAIAASLVGPHGEVHGFEPLPECFERLSALRMLNPEYVFFFNNVAVGEQPGCLTISYDPRGDSRNATLVPNSSGPIKLSVPVIRLDDYISQNIQRPERIKLIKVDVEGFEFLVLRGLKRFLAETSYRPIIICELKPWEIRKLGFSLDDFEQFIQGFGYKAYDSLEVKKKVNIKTLTDMEVLLFKA